MNKCVKTRQFMQALFDDETTANKAAEIGQAILAARSLRMTEIAAKMKGNAGMRGHAKGVRQRHFHP